VEQLREEHDSNRAHKPAAEVLENLPMYEPRSVLEKKNYALLTKLNFALGRASGKSARKAAKK